MELTTPALLFPAISLLFLAYTNRFLVLAQLIRQLHRNRDRQSTELMVLRQIDNLRRRISLVKWMQAAGVISFVLCAASMGGLFAGAQQAGAWLFGGALVALVVSLLISLWEVMISTIAISLELDDLDQRAPVEDAPQ